MKKRLFLTFILIFAVGIPAFCAADMSKYKLADCIKNCSYFRSSSFSTMDGEHIKLNEKVEGFVNGKCRYITESHYQDGSAKGMICDLDESERTALYHSKLSILKGKNSNFSSYKTVKCNSYTLKNNNWVKDAEDTYLSIPQ